MLYLRPSFPIAGAGNNVTQFLWHPLESHYSHVSFKFSDETTLVGAHLTVAAGENMEGAQNRLFFMNQNDGTPLRMGEVSQLSDNAEALKSRLYRVRNHTNDQKVYQKFSAVIQDGAQQLWATPEVRKIYQGQIKGMLEEVMNICIDLGMEYSTWFPVDG